MKKSVLFLLIFTCIFVLISCDIKSDKLYVFKLDHAPSETDWKNAVLYQISIEKGKLNNVSSEIKKLDSEVIHKSNKTSHHVQQTQEVQATLAAFYTNDMLFLRIIWPDPDENDKSAVWDSAKNMWDKTNGNEDGFSIFWNFSKNSSLNCSQKCHFDDWEVKNSILAPLSKMKTQGGEKYNLWAWWAGRNKTEKNVFDILLDSTGIHDDKQFLTNKNKIPIMCESFYTNGFWTVTIKSPLINFDLPDKQFLSDNSYMFQIAFFDNCYKDHSITSKMEQIIFTEQKTLGMKQRIKTKGIILQE